MDEIRKRAYLQLFDDLIMDERNLTEITRQTYETLLNDYKDWFFNNYVFRILSMIMLFHHDIRFSRFQNEKDLFAHFDENLFWSSINGLKEDVDGRKSWGQKYVNMCKENFNKYLQGESIHCESTNFYKMIDEEIQEFMNNENLIEAKKWLNQSSNRFAENRFRTNNLASEFVDQLYGLGAVFIKISGFNRTNNNYANTLIITMPDDEIKRKNIKTIIDNEYEEHQREIEIELNPRYIKLWWG